MTKFRESETARNLLTSFAAETQARTRYDFFAAKAAEDGFLQIARIFSETADQEYEHALRFFKFFNGGELEMTARFPTGVIRSTYDNLIASEALEHYVQNDLYKVFSGTASKEGFERAADTWDAIIVAENHHEKAFRELAENLKTGSAFEKAEKKVWRCLNCGYIHDGASAPSKCPACVKPQGVFELLCDNW